MAHDFDDYSVGTRGFVDRHQLLSTAQQDARAELIGQLAETPSIRQVRIAWGDQHGILRGKTLTARDFVHSLANGLDFQTATLVFDTTNHPVVPPFGREAFGIAAMTGLPDGVLVPDPVTFRVIPWAPETGWILADFYFADGSPIPLSTRGLLRDALAELESRGLGYVAGLEVEFYVTRLVDPRHAPSQSGWPPDPPEVMAVSHGYQYLTDNHADEIDELLSILRDGTEGLGLPLRTIEDEWGPGQCEFTFDPRSGLEAADNMLFFRSAVKQLCRRNGYHATFMSRPGLPNFFSSGWHLHQSLMNLDGRANAFADPSGAGVLSETGTAFLAGLLQHARAGAVFAVPTVNGYKRYLPDSFAPTNVSWALENRGAMARVVGCPGDPGAHIENRIGEPAANPYLYMASQILAGLDGIDRSLDPGPSSDEPYLSDRPKLPASLMEAVSCLRDDKFFRARFGDPFIDYYLTIKEHEIHRFLTSVTDWEHREYFEVY
jgi:glutamine synthetase